MFELSEVSKPLEVYLAPSFDCECIFGINGAYEFGFQVNYGLQKWRFPSQEAYPFFERRIQRRRSYVSSLGFDERIFITIKIEGKALRPHLINKEPQRHQREEDPFPGVEEETLSRIWELNLPRKAGDTWEEGQFWEMKAGHWGGPKWRLLNKCKRSPQKVSKSKKIKVLFFLYTKF